MSYKLFDFETLYLTMEYSKPSSFLAVLRGEAKMPANKIKRVCLLMQDTDKGLYQRLTDLVIIDSPEIVEPVVEQNNLSQQTNSVISKCLSEMILLLLPLAEKALSDSFTDEERRQLRKAIPQDGLYRLFRVLGGLCSKENRRNITEVQ